MDWCSEFLMKQEQQKKSLFQDIGLGAVAASIGWGCCISPLVLLFLGLTTVSGALALDSLLYGQYHWVFLLAAAVSLVIAVYFNLRRKKACSISGVKRQKTMILVMSLSMVTVYLVWSYLLLPFFFSKL